MAKPRIPKANRVNTTKERKATRESQVCIACNGTGRYDHNGSPPCGSCDGTGFNRNSEMYQQYAWKHTKTPFSC